MKPVIGISMNISPPDDENHLFSKGVEIQYIHFHYLDFVERFGGSPVLIPNFEKAVDLERLVSRMDGIIIIGGVDVDPSFYGESNRDSKGINLKRDHMEIELVKEARRQEKPLLGICRGHQVINVAYGGSLHQDILKEIEGTHKHHREANEPEQFHMLRLTRKSFMTDLFDGEEIKINSSHHQSVKKLGDGLSLIAVADDGVVEAFEAPAERCTVGVQWHPERILDDPNQQRLAKWFISQASLD